VPEDRISLLAGDQPPAERYAHYLRTLEPTPVIVLGSRHAVYAPAHNLGLIIVLDDADSAHREPLAPYPHSRDVALLRNSMENVAVCFASATPSLAVRRWIDMGYIAEHSAAGSTRPRVIPTSLTLGQEALSSPARLPSSVYQAVKVALARRSSSHSGLPERFFSRPQLRTMQVKSIVRALWRTLAEVLRE
jgi:primosomal protein N' (replication factor Y)